MLTQTHYDDYSNLPTNSPSGLTATFQTTWNSNFLSTNLSALPYPVMPMQASTYLPKGMVTWAQAEVLGTSGGTYLTSVNIYDEKGRVIQVQSQNYSGGIDITTTQYNWAGQQLATVHKEQKAGTNAQTTITVSRTYYDNLNRPVKTTKQIQNTLVSSNALTAENNISQMQYDKLGELEIKNLGNTKSGTSYTSTPLETLNYDYNIRGWLLGVNRAFVRDLSTASSGTNSGETFTTPPSYSAGNYFGFELGYDKAPTVGSSSWTGSIQYNGNITGMIWKSVHDGQIRKYDYSYDNVNRLLTANFTQYTGTSFNQTAGINYTVNGLGYDANGNITGMTQYGLAAATATTSVAIDQLTYTPITGTNKLQSVSDAANGNTPASGTAGYLGDYHYASGSSSGAVYIYDNNGNLTSDNNKHINNITYNYLNLPQTVTVTGKGTITYTYDAAGDKLQKQTVEGSTTTTTLYGAGTMYINNVLQFIAHEEGRIRVNSSSSGYIFDYFLKDHLGNIRMTISDDNNLANPLLESQSFYPFGLLQTNISKQVATNLHNKFLYNNKEQQKNEFADLSGLEWYDYGARMYDAQIGRWMKQDNSADFYFGTSPYVYALNQPTQAVDPDGDLVIFINGFTFDNSQLGNSSYWRHTFTRNQIVSSQSNGVSSFGVPLSNDEFITTYVKQVNFDEEVMSQLNDHHSIYKDGSIGGWKSLFDAGFSFDANNRYRIGNIQGNADAKNIIASLARDKNGNIVESIKVITHSMGGAYAKGYIKAILVYAKKHKIEGVKIDFEADFAPLEPKDQKAIKDKSMGSTLQFSHSNDAVAGNSSMENADQINTSNDPNQGHSIYDFENQISKLPSGKYKVVNGQIIPE